MTYFFLSHKASAEQVVETQFPTEDIVIAKAIVSAPTNGFTDASSIIQAEIDSASDSYGGVVFLPAGRYRLDNPLIIREGVTLRGDWVSPASGTVQGTILMPFADRGNADGTAAITIERGAGIRDLSIWYPEQYSNAVVPYPWTVRTSSEKDGNNTTVQNVTFVNSYQAMKFGPEWNELHTIRNVYGTALKTALYIDYTLDTGRVYDLHFSPRWWENSGLPSAPTSDSQKQFIRSYMKNNGTGITIGRSDWELFRGLHIEGYATGMECILTDTGTTNAFMYGSEFLDCGTALYLKQPNIVGLAVTASKFEGENYAVHAPNTFYYSRTPFNRCEFACQSGVAVLHEGLGELGFQNCTFTRWQGPAIQAKTGTLLVMGSEFQQDGQHIAIESAVTRALILGNQFPGTPGISNSSSGDIQVAHSGVTFEKPSLDYLPQPTFPKPDGNNLFQVTDYGASPSLTDNTTAFTQALEAARASGGTVFVPSGNYRFEGCLIVPSGVELRGSFDVPHHVVSGGSVLMPTAGSGNENGTPFIRLESGSGVRGLSIWYPEHDLLNITPYPWTIQSLGTDCWLVDITLGNSYLGVDFASYPSAGHFIRYLAGACLKKGLEISQNSGTGWVEDIQWNPHYAVRLHDSIPRPDYPGEDQSDPLIASQVFTSVASFQRENLQAVSLGQCNRQYVQGVLVYAALEGINFYADEAGGPNAHVINYLVDTGTHPMVVRASGDDGIQCNNCLLLPDNAGPALTVEEEFEGKLKLFTFHLFKPSRLLEGSTLIRNSVVIDGMGEVLLQQFHPVIDKVVIRGKKTRIENMDFYLAFSPQIEIESKSEQVYLIGNHGPGQLRVEDNTDGQLIMRYNSVSLYPEDSVGEWLTGWEEGEPESYIGTIAQGNLISNVNDAECSPVAGSGRNDGSAVRVVGTATNSSNSHVYFKLFDQPIRVYFDTTLTYWIKPQNDLGRHVGIDLRLSNGDSMRDMGISDKNGTSTHPAAPRGTIGVWKKIEVPIGMYLADSTITEIMIGFDISGTTGSFETYIDDFAIKSDTWTQTLNSHKSVMSLY